MAKKQSTSRRAKADESRKPAAAPLSELAAAQMRAPPVNFHDLLNELLDVKAAIRLSQEAASKARDLVCDEDPRVQELIDATEGVLSMAWRALDQAYDHIDTPAVREAWPVPSEEVSHGS